MPAGDWVDYTDIGSDIGLPHFESSTKEDRPSSPLPVSQSLVGPVEVVVMGAVFVVVSIIALLIAPFILACDLLKFVAKKKAPWLLEIGDNILIFSLCSLVFGMMASPFVILFVLTFFIIKYYLV